MSIPTPLANNHLWHRSQHPAQVRGYSLLEVLVALFVISIGLLGIAGLSAGTLNYNKAAQFRLTGITLVNDYADKARANVFGYDRGGYNITLGSAVTLPTLDLDEAVAATAADAVAQYDRSLFLTTVAGRLPGGTAVVTSNPTANSRNLDIWLLWEEAKAAQKDVDGATEDDKLFTAGQKNCPSTLSADEKAKYSCMYFSVGL
jgi:type IV pilus assembly protein PilV